jgi:hypothetical protein
MNLLSSSPFRTLLILKLCRGAAAGAGLRVTVVINLTTYLNSGSRSRIVVPDLDRLAGADSGHGQRRGQ